MAHHIVELIHGAEASGSAAGDTAAAAAAAAVLGLWEHRAGAAWQRPAGAPGPPLESFDPIFKVLAEWASPYKPWRFTRVFDDVAPPTPGDVDQNQLLQIALAADEAVREVVTAAVAAAGRAAVDREGEWLAVAQRLGSDSERTTLQMLRALQQYTGMIENDSPTAGGTEDATSESNDVADRASSDAERRRTDRAEGSPARTEGELHAADDAGIDRLVAALDRTISELTRARRMLRAEPPG